MRNPFGNPDAGEQVLRSQGPAVPLTPGGAPLGSLTGAPPRTVLRASLINVGRAPTQIVEPTRENRVVTLLAPFVGFSIFIGGSGVRVGDMRLPPALPYDIVIPGMQELYAISDSPVQLLLGVVIAPLLLGDRERQAERLGG